MTKKRILAIFIALLCVCFCSCTRKPETAEYNSRYGTFVVINEGKVGSYASQTLMYDPETRVMYTYLDGQYAGTMSVLYNADGTLKTYSPED